MVDIEHTRRLARVSLLCACALVLSYLETMIPLPVAVPGIKLGLANVAVVVALYTLDAKSAGAVALVKVFASGFLFGSPMMLVYSLGGTVLAFIGMVALAAVPGVGLVPVSMLAAVLHNVGQLGVAAMALQTPAVFINLGVLGVAACVTGGITGAVAEGALAGIEQADDTRPSVDCAALAANIVAGERIAFVGTNGSGKSTCALELAGLLKDVNGHAMCVQGTVGLAFQDPDNQIVAPVVRDDIAFGLENRGVPRDEMRSEVLQALNELGIVELEQRDVATLSGGQKQRVAASGLVALTPSLMIFDETTAMLDETAREAVNDLIDHLCQRDVAVIQITQLLDEVARADRVAVFEAGAIAYLGTVQDLADQRDLLIRCGLEELCR
ncbi:Gx transporter family protein [Collinsella aerofaciens]|uniref:Gx transporter family protein n=1 Tax=Collinsella aerofaciens TaxID=74426 RepID=UPI00189D0B31|nr:Gx transporter family protein [Collinsella aerofaciens]